MYAPRKTTPRAVCVCVGDVRALWPIKVLLSPPSPTTSPCPCPHHLPSHRTGRNAADLLFDFYFRHFFPISFYVLKSFIYRCLQMF
jgi:hypothetical protein